MLQAIRITYFGIAMNLTVRSPFSSQIYGFLKNQVLGVGITSIGAHIPYYYHSQFSCNHWLTYLQIACVSHVECFGELKRK